MTSLKPAIQWKLPVPICDCYFTCNGRKMEDDEVPPEGAIIRFHPKLVGGKGGFGSMLRAIGARIEKTTNHEACRDLSGRRMRDVNNEKQISEWLQDKETKEKEKEQKRQDRIERTLNPKMKYEDKDYTISLQGNVDKINEAMKIANAKGKSCKAGDKRKVSVKPNKNKKPKLWLGLELSDEESGESETSDEEGNGIVGVEELTRSGETTKDKAIHEEEDSQYPKKEILNASPVQETIQRNAKKTPEYLDLSEFKNAEELQAAGLERLKSALMFHGMKCDGTLQQRAERLFLTKNTPVDQLDASLFVKDSSKVKS